MFALFDWPISLPHRKCDSDEQVVIEQVSVQRTGVLVFLCFCWGCNDEFLLTRNMLELTAQAFVNDRDLIGDVPETLPEAHCTKPN